MNQQVERIIIRDLDNAVNRIAKAIHEVSQAAYAIESRIIDFPFLPPLKETVQDILASEDRFTGCYLGGDLMGVIETSKKNDTLWINRLVVKPEYFNNKVATTLIAHAVGDYRPCFVMTAKANYPAIALYKKLGFTHYSSRDKSNPDITLVTYTRG